MSKHRDNNCEVPFCKECLANIKALKQTADTLYKRANPTTPDDAELTQQIYEAMQTPWLSERHDAIKRIILADRRRLLERIIAEQQSYLSGFGTRDNPYIEAVPVAAILRLIEAGDGL